MNPSLLRSLGLGWTVLLILCTAGYIQDVQSALLDDLNNPNSVTCPTGPLPNFVPCNADCREQHNAAGGLCDSQNNCICSGPGVPRPSPQLLTSCNYNFTLGTTPLPPAAAAPICHCMSDATDALHIMFDHACNFDCQCAHGAASGSCDFDATACLCDYPPAPWVWVPQTRVGCTASALLNATACIAEAAVSGVIPPGC